MSRSSPISEGLGAPVFFVLRDKDGHNFIRTKGRGLVDQADMRCTAALHTKENSRRRGIEIFKDGQWMNADDLP
jgi:hypothetical protein